jgi:hypothetical protein
MLEQNKEECRALQRAGESHEDGIEQCLIAKNFGGELNKNES